MARPSARHHLLETAAELVVERGANQLTFDALAEVAGVSKGGLLYHFPTKTDLVAAMLDDILDRFETSVDRQAAAASQPVGAWARAYIDATFDVEVSRPELAFALLLASPDVTTELLRRCSERFTVWHERLEADGLPEGSATVIRYACDGWWTMSVMGMAIPSQHTEALRSRLLDLVDEVAP